MNGMFVIAVAEIITHKVVSFLFERPHYHALDGESDKETFCVVLYNRRSHCARLYLSMADKLIDEALADSKQAPGKVTPPAGRLRELTQFSCCMVRPFSDTLDCLCLARTDLIFYSCALFVSFSALLEVIFKMFCDAQVYEGTLEDCRVVCSNLSKAQLSCELLPRTFCKQSQSLWAKREEASGARNASVAPILVTTDWALI